MVPVTIGMILSTMGGSGSEELNKCPPPSTAVL